MGRTKEAGAKAPASPYATTYSLLLGLLGGLALRRLAAGTLLGTGLLRRRLLAGRPLLGASALLCSHGNLSCNGVERSIEPPVVRTSQRSAPECFPAAARSHGETVKTRRRSDGVAQAGEVEVSDLQCWNHDRLTRPAILARADPHRRAERLEVVQHEDGRV